MGLTPEEAAAQVDLLVRELSVRQRDIDTHEDYYAGKHSLKFASEPFKKAFGGLFGKFSDNWCQVVVDACAERLEVTGFRAQGTRENDEETWSLWREHGLDVDSNLAFVDAMVTARAFGLAWDGPDGLELSFEHASQAIVGYAPGSRRKRVAGLKWWADDQWEYTTLYTPDEAWKFQRRRERPSGGGNLIVVSSAATFGAGQWEPRLVAGEEWPLRHTIGVVPLVEIRNRPRTAAEPSSDIANVIPLQDSVNLTWSQLMTAADFAAFPQRVVMGMERPVTPQYDDAGNVVGEKPVDLEKFHVSRVAFLEGEKAQIGEWTAADLKNYTHVIETAVQHIAAQTRTPPHYLLGQMVNISGDGMTAAETGLVARATEKQRNFGGDLREFMAVAHLADGNPAAAAAISAGTTMWRDAEHRTFGELVDGVLKLSTVLPREALYERLGFDQTEITRLLAMEPASVPAAVPAGPVDAL